MAKQGRPKKIENELKETKKATKSPKTKEVDIDELVAQKVAEIMAKKAIEEQSIIQKNTPKKEKRKKPSENIRVRKYVPDGTIVRVVQNIDGGFIIGDNRGNSFYYELNGYGDSIVLDFKELKNYHGRHHGSLNKGKIKITSVSSPDPEVGLGDVIEDLNLDGLYFGENNISPLDIEYYLLEEDDLSEFDTKLKNSKAIMGTIVEVSKLLHDQGKFNDNSKMNLIRLASGKHDLFTVNDLFKNVRRVNKN